MEWAQYVAFCCCCCKNTQSSNSNNLPDICHPSKCFFVLLSFWDFAQMYDTSVGTIRVVTMGTQWCKWNGVWSLKLMLVLLVSCFNTADWNHSLWDDSNRSLLFALADKCISKIAVTEKCLPKCVDIQNFTPKNGFAKYQSKI